MYNKKDFLDLIRENLEKETTNLVGNFGNLRNLKISKEVDLLLIETNVGEDEIELTLAFYDNEAGQVFDAKEGFSGVMDLTKDFLLFQHPDDENFYDFYEENNLEEEIIIEIGNWVKKCFDKALVGTISVPLYFSVHDASEVLNLQTGKWIDSEDIWN